MLTNLLGSKSAERVLLFLLVNEYGYASEIQKAYHISLTPLQSIIRKLEKGGVLIYELQQKKKLYRINPEYPLFDELKALLKKGFVCLPFEEKKVLFSRKTQWSASIQNHYAHQKRISLCLGTFWQRLSKVKHVSIQTQSAGQAFGEVHIHEENKNTLVFTEQGQWHEGSPQEMVFHNTLRWSLDLSAGLISLEHLRYGPNKPVFLIALSPLGPNTLQSIDSHLCCSDCYFGRIEFTEKYIRFLWRILGPKKNEVLHHTYSW